MTGRLTCAAAMLLLACGGPVQAADLRLGVQTEANSIDPHYYVGGEDNQVHRHMFNSLIGMDIKQRIVPELATSWTLVDPTTWRFELRNGVRFHNGDPFTANDVIYTVCRIRNFKDALSSYVRYTAAIKDLQADGPSALIVKTTEPYPALLNELSTFEILSARANRAPDAIAFDNKDCGIKEWPKSTDFNSGAAAIGTGPYKFVEYVHGSRLVMARNDDYWGGKPEWDRVVMMPIASSAARIAALLAGDVDVIDSPPPQDIDRLKSNARVTITAGPSQVFMYLQFEHKNEPAVGISGTSGKNPLRDRRVREAISKAIDRKAIVDKIMRGYAQVATNVMGPDYFGFNPDIKPEPYDPATARRLLAEAGYPDGFTMVMGVTNDRYSNDAKIGQAVAQMLARVGIKVQIDEAPFAVFVKKWQTSQYPFFQTGLAVNSVDMAQTLRALVGTPGAAAGFGVVNYGHYSNAAFDAVVKQAVSELDDAKRRALLQQANRMVMEDYGILALIHPMNTWAHRRDYVVEPRNDNSTVATNIHPPK